MAGNVLIFVFLLVGLALGSFLNVVIDRLPTGQSLVRPPSHCPGCGQRLAPLDLVPLGSYLLLRGRCRYCGATIPQRIFWVELATGLLFMLLFWLYGLSAELGVLIVYTCLFITIFVIDLEQGLILNKLTYPAMIFALATVPLRADLTVIDSLIGGGIGLVLLLLVVVISRGGMGWGDVKMAGLMGLATGYPIIFVALLTGIILGGLFAIGLVLFRRRGRKDTIPFGPFLAIGAMIALMWGNVIWDWYTTPFG